MQNIDLAIPRITGSACISKSSDSTVCIVDNSLDFILEKIIIVSANIQVDEDPPFVAV